MPKPVLPNLKLLYTAQSKFGYVSGGGTRDYNIAYMIPKLSCILVANNTNCFVLIPGDQTTIYNVKCNVIPMGYLLIDDTITLIFENISYTFKNN